MNDEIIGTRIGIYDVISQLAEKSKDGHKVYRIRCSQCGWETNIEARFIIRLCQTCKHTNCAGQYKSNAKNLSWKNQRIKYIYSGLIQRCYNQNEKSYRWYGAKGVRICKEWLCNPLAFEEWALASGYAEDLTIDRKNSADDYCPTNCRWVSLFENAKYKSTTSLITVDDAIHSGRDWAAILNLGTNTINKMLREYPLEQVVDFIRLRLQDNTKKRKSHHTWMETYGLPK